MINFISVPVWIWRLNFSIPCTCYWGLYVRHCKLSSFPCKNLWGIGNPRFVIHFHNWMRKFWNYLRNKKGFQVMNKLYKCLLISPFPSASLINHMDMNQAEEPACLKFNVWHFPSDKIFVFSEFRCFKFYDLITFWLTLMCHPRKE